MDMNVGRERFIHITMVGIYRKRVDLENTSAVALVRIPVIFS